MTKRLVVLVVALVMALVVAVPALAQEGVNQGESVDSPPVPTDRKSVTVTFELEVQGDPPRTKASLAA